MKEYLTLRLPAELARALTRWASTRHLPKSAVVREAVERYLAPTAVEGPARRVTARELAARWAALPRLTPREARRHADLWAELAKRGRMIGPHDLLIGATALAHGYALATLNRREFRRVPGLVLR